MMDSARAQEIITEMVRQIVEHFHPEMVVLFGSYARGTPGPDSHVDLLVVLADPGSKLDKAAAIYHLLGGIGLPKDIIVLTPESARPVRSRLRVPCATRHGLNCRRKSCAPKGT